VVTWDGREWQLANIGATTVALLGEGGRLLELPDATLESLVKQGRIKQSSEDTVRRSDRRPGWRASRQNEFG
jgi:hypothetical protein